MTPSRMAKLISHRPEVPPRDLAEYIVNRFGLSADHLKTVHNQVLLAQATKRYELRAVQKTVPNHKTPEATADFFDAFAKTVREAGSSGTDEDFI